MHDPLFNPQQLTVLVVDDQDSIRKGIKRLAERMGFREVIECTDGAEAIELLASRQVDIIITDLYMKKRNGLEVLEFVRNRDMGSDIPIIIVTGESGQADIVAAADKGARDYLLKPFQSSDLEKKITRSLETFFSPSDFLKDLRSAERLFMLGKLDEARNFFELASKKDPNSARALHGLALTWAKLGFEDMAIPFLEKCIALNPNYYRAYASVANIYLKKGLIKDGTLAMVQELNINPKQSHRQIQLGNLLLKQGQPKEAMEHYRLALKEDPKRMTALMGMGHALTKLGKIDKALYYFTRVRRYDPNALKALEAGVRACMVTKDWLKAERFLKAEKSAHPNHLDSYLLLAALFFEQNRNQAVIELADEILSKKPDHLDALHLKAKALAKLQSNNELLPTLEHIASQNPSAEIFYQIAEVHQKNQNLEASIQALHEALKFEDNTHKTLLLLADILKARRLWLEASLLYKRAELLGAPQNLCQKEFAECIQHARIRRARQGLHATAS